MNILFLSLGRYKSVNEEGIYTDLLREFINHGHNVTILSSMEIKEKNTLPIIEEKNCMIVRVFTGKIQKTNIIEKGINTILIETRYKNAIKKYLKKISYDLVLYPTPPITLVSAVQYVKKRDNATSYLLLKDIFPQNAVDIGMLRKTGIKGVLYKYFRLKEKKLYRVSDYIGCMSPANKEYLLRHNSEINAVKVMECPNSIETVDKSVNFEVRKEIRNKYQIPMDKKVFVYGGNLGKPQGIDFLIKCMYSQRNNNKVYFIIVGDGTEYGKLEQFFEEHSQNNLKLMKRLPKEDYDALVACCDVGMIFLDHRFTIPNFPSRLLSYMQTKLPVLAVTDINTDVGKVIVEGGFGWWCESSHIQDFSDKIGKILTSDIENMGENGFMYLKKHFSTKDGYLKIMNCLENGDKGEKNTVWENGK